jgi:hypothetical protein
LIRCDNSVTHGVSNNFKLQKKVWCPLVTVGTISWHLVLLWVVHVPTASGWAACNHTRVVLSNPSAIISKRAKPSAGKQISESRHSSICS